MNFRGRYKLLQSCSSIFGFTFDIFAINTKPPKLGCLHDDDAALRADFDKIAKDFDNVVQDASEG